MDSHSLILKIIQPRFSILLWRERFHGRKALERPVRKGGYDAALSVGYLNSQEGARPGTTSQAIIPHVTVPLVIYNPEWLFFAIFHITLTSVFGSTCDLTNYVPPDRT